MPIILKVVLEMVLEVVLEVLEMVLEVLEMVLEARQQGEPPEDGRVLRTQGRLRTRSFLTRRKRAPGFSYQELPYQKAL